MRLDRGDEAIAAGATELSLGYSLRSAKGEPQRGTRVDHVALVTAARCGPSCSLRVDCAGGSCECARVIPGPDLTASNSRATVTHSIPNGVLMSKTNEELQAANTELLANNSNLQSRLDAAEKDRDGHKSRADSAEGEVVSLRHQIEELEKRLDGDDRAELQSTIEGLNLQLGKERKAREDAESPERLREGVRARVSLEASALGALGEKDRARFDDKTDREVMTIVLQELQGTKVEDKKSDDYVRARYDAAVESYFRGKRALENFRRVADPEPSKRVDSLTPRQKMIKRNQNAWRKQPASAEA